MDEDDELQRMGRVECNVLVPKEEAGGFRCVLANFGGPVSVTKPSRAMVIQLQDPYGCKRSIEDVPPSKTIRGKIHPFAVLVDRGKCYFHEKAKLAQDMGASFLIVANSQRRPAEKMAGPTQEPMASQVRRIKIPSLMVGSSDGLWLRNLVSLNTTLVSFYSKSSKFSRILPYII